VQEHHGGWHFRIASPSPCLLLGSADWLQCEGYNWEVQAKKAHAVASSFEAPLLELNAQVIILISSCTVIPYTPFLQLNKLWCLFYDLHTLKSMQPHVSLLLQTFQITWTIWHSLPTNCRDLCKPSYNPFYVHSVALIPFAIIPFAKKKKMIVEGQRQWVPAHHDLKLLVKKKRPRKGARIGWCLPGDGVQLIFELWQMLSVQ